MSQIHIAGEPFPIPDEQFEGDKSRLVERWRDHFGFQEVPGNPGWFRAPTGWDVTMNDGFGNLKVYTAWLSGTKNGIAVNWVPKGRCTTQVFGYKPPEVKVQNRLVKDDGSLGDE